MMNRFTLNKKAVCSEKMLQGSLSHIGSVFSETNYIVDKIVFNTNVGYFSQSDDKHKDVHGLFGSFVKSGKAE